MAKANLTVIVAGDPRSLERALKRAGASTDKFAKDSERATKRTAKAHAGMGKAIAGGLALGAGGLAVGLKSLTDAAAESEKSTVRMRAQLRASGLSYDKYGERIDRVIQKQSQLAALDDEDLQDAFTNIVRTTGDVSRSLELVAVASDLARGKQMDVAKAGEIVAKVAGGNVGILSRYGITVEKGATATEALALLQRKFSGQAADYGKSNASAMDRWAVSSENLKEKLGSALLPVLADAANAGARFLTQIERGTGAGGQFAAVVTTIATNVAQVASAGYAFATSAEGAVVLSAAVGGLAARLTGLGIASVVSSVGALTTGLRGAGGAMAAFNLVASKFGGPWVMLASIVGTVVGGLVGYSMANQQAKVSAQDLTDAIDRQRDAMRRVADLDIEAAQRKANLKTATAAQAAAERELHNARASGDTVRIKQAEAALEQARIQVKRTTREVARTEQDAASARRQDRAETEKATSVYRGRVAMLSRERSETRNNIAAIRDQIAAGKANGATQEQLAPLQREYTRLKQKDAEQTRAIGRATKQIPKEVRSRIFVSFKLGGVSGFLNESADVLTKGLKNVQKDAGDVAGPAGPSIGGGLLGGLTGIARSGYGTIANKFGGIRLTSGRRSPGENARVGGAKNSDHLTGNAIDLVPAEGWNTRSIARFDRIAAWARQQPNIRFIGWRGVPNHGPGNHLHLSFKARSFGGAGRAVGDYGIDQLKGLARGEGLSDGNASIAAAVAMAESGGDPKASNRNTDGSIDRGLWQINSVHGALSTFDVAGNTRAMDRISRNGTTWTPWVTFKTGAYRKFLPAAQRAKSNTSARAGGRVGTPSAKKGTGSAGGGFLSGLVRKQQIQEGSSFTQGEAKTSSNPAIADNVGAPTGKSVAEFLREQRYDSANAALALAGLTEDKADDLTALGTLQGLTSADLAAAQGRGDNKAIIELAGALKSVNDQIKGLKESMEENAAAINAARADAERQLKEQAQRDLRLSQSQYGVLAKAVSDVANGGIGGKVGLGFMTPGFAGGGVRY